MPVPAPVVSPAPAMPAPAAPAASVSGAIPAPAADPVDHDAEDAAVSLKVNTRRGCERIVRAAFEFASKHGRRKVTCVHKAKVQQVRSGRKLHVTLRGTLGHRIEECHPGVILTYGPLVLVPST